MDKWSLNGAELSICSTKAPKFRKIMKNNIYSKVLHEVLIGYPLGTHVLVRQASPTHTHLW
ncbi:hypothetical protein KFK09_013035 [Dendrobium nobile]|uniref:Uncharacterized protein n=1 Tax=Dendrobium nobile TaxID=94219 RepID=A0A8T3BH59_DENNO|nr:hypothetical protein KFK09_013035 [Dendrobium nobile]